MCICSFLVWKNACLNYCEFDLEGDLVGVPHTWYLSAKSFIILFKLVWREYDIVAMNEWKKKYVGLQRTWVSKRTVFASNSTYKWICYLRHDDKQSPSFQMTYDTTFCQDNNLNPGRVTPCTRKPFVPPCRGWFIRNITVIRLLRMQPKVDTLICLTIMRPALS